MIIWKGRGFLAALIPFVCGVTLQLLIGDSPIYAGIGYIIGGIPVWFLGKKWNSEPGRVMTDNQTGSQVEIKNEHSLFWIKMEYWAAIAAILGNVIIVSELV